MQKFLLLLFLLMSEVSIVFSQNDADNKEITDTTSLQYFIAKGELHIHANSFLIATDNEKNLTDYYAFAAGAGIGYETAKLKGFQLGGSGFFTYNIYSSDLSKPDSITGLPNRYEILMLDMEHPSSHRELKRLEQLYIKYTFRKSFLQLGKMILNTPFINKQEGKMRPTTEEGAWIETDEIRNLKIQGGWLWAISPRSTTRWFSMANSVGVYPGGLNTDGTKSAYAGNIKSKGVGLIGATYHFNSFKISLWDNYFENVINTSMIQLEAGKKLNERKNLSAAIQFIHQDAIHNGGNDSSNKTYVLPGSVSNSISAKAGINFFQYNAVINFTHITNDGRYLNPREWGYDPFYTFLPRELNEGLGNVNALSTRLEWKNKNQSLRSSLAYGVYQLPDVKNIRLNKYGMPSYHHVNLDFKYSFPKYFKGMSVLFLIAYKKSTGETYGNKKHIFNKVNLVNYNFALDYVF